MKKLTFNPMILVVVLLLAGLALTGCARDREEPVPAVGESTTTAVAPSAVQPAAVTTTPQAESKPTTLAVPATATSTSSVVTTSDGGILTVPTATAIPSAPLPAQTGSGSSGISTGGQGEQIHIVQPGENLFRIALQYGLDTMTVARYNGISNPELIYVGQSIKIPGGGSGVSNASGSIYIVQSGDTLASIALKFNTTVSALMNANDITNANLVYVGQQLTVP